MWQMSCNVDHQWSFRSCSLNTESSDSESAQQASNTVKPLYSKISFKFGKFKIRPTRFHNYSPIQGGCTPVRNQVCCCAQVSLVTGFYSSSSSAAQILWPKRNVSIQQNGYFYFLLRWINWRKNGLFLISHFQIIDTNLPKEVIVYFAQDIICRKFPGWSHFLFNFQK